MSTIEKSTIIKRATIARNDQVLHNTKPITLYQLSDLRREIEDGKHAGYSNPKLENIGIFSCQLRVDVDVTHDPALSHWISSNGEIGYAFVESILRIQKEEEERRVELSRVYLDRYGRQFKKGSKVAFNRSGEVCIGYIQSMEYTDRKNAYGHLNRTLKGTVVHRENGESKTSSMSNLFSSAVVLKDLE